MHAVPPAATDEGGFVDGVARVSGDYDVVLPAGDAEVMTLSRHRAALGARFPYPAHEVLETYLDKQVLAHRAEAFGIASPRIHSREDLAAGAVDLPLIVKQRWVGTDASARRETQRVESAEQVLALLERWDAMETNSLLQEVVEGDLLALSLLMSPAGTVVAAVQSVGERITWPPRTGMRLRSRTVPVDEDLLDRVGAMLASDGWWGLVDVDFLAPDVGPPRLIDCNGRFYASMAIADAAGVNFPDLWGRMALGHPVPTRLLGRAGVRYHWLEGDLRRAVGTRAGLADVAGSIAHAAGAAHTIGLGNDPVPGIRHLGTLAARAVRRIGGPLTTSRA